ncbi:glycosyltransferase [Emticicia sp. CRIBPO]|uniref:glycosyltransferase family 4 protein n=1 Tax=Emticicia sp. CRIBPO TaxID=2683258 RepID=UPI00141369C5|nr:glycosyltransferase family 4 protein [Emticicia sp. CRIBPO]NBA84235.1 glycosyltransferase [Emticicia sp. CRIBPO]
MKVLILHNILWTHYKSVLFEEIYRKAPSGVEVMVLQIARNEISRKGMESQNTEEWKYKYHLLFDDYLENISSSAKILAVFRYIIKYKPDVINISGYGIDISITLSILLARILGIKIIISSESTVQDQSRNSLKEGIKKFLVGCADGFFCFGSLAREYMLKLGASPSQIFEDAAAIVDDKTVLKEFLKAQEEGFTHPAIQKKKNFIFVGRLIPVKNLSLLLEAYKALKTHEKAAEDWGLIILGDGEEKGQCLSYVTENNLQDIAFIPAMPWYEIPKLFTVSQTLILPSFSETWGLVVNEAMVCGLSVIVSDQCGCAPDLVRQGENGFVFPSGNAGKLIEAMTTIVKNDHLSEQMGLKSKEIIRRFSVESVAGRMVDSFTFLNRK